MQEQAGVKDQKKVILKTTVGRRIAADAEIHKLTESSKALEQLIMKLEREKKKTEQEAVEKMAFTEKKNRLPWPVQGNIVMKFGRNKHPEFDTYIISNGVRIKTAGNCDVKAVSKGEIIFCGDFRSYGLMVIIDHGGGFYSVYGSLGDISVSDGAQVKAGGVIGELSSGDDPVLYFEVRADGKVQDPLLWLK